MQVISYSHVGAVRKNNEDSVFADADLGLLAVADGIGGQEDGEVASAMAIHIISQKVAESCQNEQPLGLDLLKEACYEANNNIYTQGKKIKSEYSMGTTLTTVLVVEKAVYLVHVGDSRAYLCSDAEIRLLTHDHSLAGELAKDGSITPEEAAHHPQRNILTRSLGHEPLVTVDELELTWQEGDYLFLCSDGLYNLVQMEEIYAQLQTSATLEAKAQALVTLALRRGGYDNISVVIAHCS